MTKQKKVIADFLAHTKSHPTAEEVFFEAKKSLPSIAFGTVYRNLSQMVDSGEVRRITVPGAPDRFDGDTARHDHVMCVRCHRLFDIPAVNVADAPAELPDGMEVVGYEVMFRAVCAQCAKKEKADG